MPQIASRPIRQRPSPLLALALLLALLCVSCAETSPPTAPPLAMVPPSPLNPPSTGEALFLGKQWPEALLQFEHDYETALASSDRQQAYFGLACTQVVLAGSDEQLAQAIANLELWVEQHQQSPVAIMPRLLVVALKTQAERLQKKGHEFARLIKQKNSVIAAQSKKIEEMAGSLEKLQNQLRELEAIDETLQEKRKAL